MLYRLTRIYIAGCVLGIFKSVHTARITLKEPTLCFLVDSNQMPRSGPTGNISKVTSYLLHYLHLFTSLTLADPLRPSLLSGVPNVFYTIGGDGVGAVNPDSCLDVEFSYNQARGYNML